MNCPICNKRARQVRKIKNKEYVLRWCKRCDKEHYEKPYAKYKKDYCESCGFIPRNMVQLDVDHIDGNHSNNLQNNLQTLCSNCHRLKTFEQRWG